MTASHVVTEGPLPPASHPAATSPSTAPAAAPATVPTPDFYQAAISGAGIPVVGMDPLGRICLWNQTAARLFGRSEGEVLGHPLDVVVPLEYRPVAAQALLRTLQQKSVNFYEMAFVPPGGRNPQHLGVTLSAVLGPDGTPAGVMAWVRDISNRKSLESHLSSSQHMASLGTLAAGVAHHFNNIVCGMSAMVDLALATQDPSAIQRALELSAEAAARIGYITQSLLAFSAQECGEPDLADLTEEILRFADAVEPTLNKKGIQLVLDLRAGRVAAVPRHRFGQVLHHLLKNAEEALDEAQARRQPADPPRERRVTLSTESQEERLLFRFSDTGCGIPTEDLRAVFQPFYTTKGVHGGGHQNNPGLGLALVAGVATDMGGQIWAESAPGEWTTINLLLPIIV